MSILHKYALFCGDVAPMGGWADFYGNFPTIEEAKSSHCGQFFTWAQVVDLFTGEIVSVMHTNANAEWVWVDNKE